MSTWSVKVAGNQNTTSQDAIQHRVHPNKHATLTVLFLSGLRHSAVSYSFIQVGGNLGKIKTQCLNLLSLGIS